ncbi:MAG: septal ring lytic transglycosylase RlpA family protein [Solirubrobacteraceae bacterium]|nr:septal ring lytic transglycosylase RlpA family protein [Solirubrobacteraceae bacterium]
MLVACLPASVASAQEAPAASASSAPTAEASTAPASDPIAGGASILDEESPTSSSLVHILERDLTLTSKSMVAVTVRALDVPVHLELRVGATGRKVADAAVQPGDRTVLHGGALRGEELHLLVTRVDGTPSTDDVTVGVARRTVRLRQAQASWYGPGLFGNRTACGQTLTRGLRGVAHKKLPCGTKLTVKFRGRSTKATVVDRGPFHGNREFDLTQATAQAIGFKAVGRVWVSS